MRGLAAGLTFVSFATVAGLLFGIVGHGLTAIIASAAFTVGIFAAALAYLKTTDPRPRPAIVHDDVPWFRYRDTWKWLVAFCFAIFAVRSFCWLFYIDGDQFYIQSPNNLGDLALHLTFIKNFANGVSLWPDNPIFDGSKLRYPAGIDLFNALLSLQHVDLMSGLVWVGLLGSLATYYAFHRWGGTFAVAGFLFNGGLVGFKYLGNFKFSDYQGTTDIAWKSIPLSMFVTQRGLLYAIPAGLLLLWHWREKFSTRVAPESNGQSRPSSGPLPFWVELSLYASMPLFHVHTFLALSGVLVCFAIFGDSPVRKSVAWLVGSAFLPATFFVWLITDYFRARSVFEWAPGWVQKDAGEFAAPFLVFWIKNFGFWVPLVLFAAGLVVWKFVQSKTTRSLVLVITIALGGIALCVFRFWNVGFAWKPAIVFFLFLGLLGYAAYSLRNFKEDRPEKVPEDLIFLFAAAAIFLFAFFIKTAPWGWDNLKIMVWAYFLVLPLLWNRLLQPRSLSFRAVVIVALFGSGFVSLFGGLAAGRPGFGFADRAEVDGVGDAVRQIPAEARFAAYPTFNHPLLLQGRKVVLGYPGHLWTEGFDYTKMEQQLTQLMNGAANWQQIVSDLHVQYVFWGTEEAKNYGASRKPWETTTKKVAGGGWGAIYDVNQPASTAP